VVQASKIGRTMPMSSSKLVAVLLLSALVVAACSGGSAGSVLETPEPSVQLADSPTAVPDDAPPTAVPTAVPIVLTNEQMVAAAIDAFDAAPEPAELIAWDHLDAEVAGDKVTLRLCSWTGDTVFDEVRLVNYIVEPDVDGNPTTQLIFSNPTPGECLNTELINSAFEAINAYDTYWGGVLEDPTTFDEVEAAKYQSSDLVEVSEDRVEGWIRDGLEWRGVRFEAGLPDALVVPSLWRTYELGSLAVFEVLVCGDLDPAYGLYQSDSLVDDFKPEVAAGNHTIDSVKLSRDDSRWVIRGVEAFAWSNCFAFEPNWLEGMNEMNSELGRWRLVEEPVNQ